MTRSIKLLGGEANVKLLIDEVEWVSFSRAQAISALEFYEALDYHPGDVYDVCEPEFGEVPEKALRPLHDLLKDIVEEINKLAESPVGTAFGSVSPEPMGTPTEDSYPDIPF